MPLVDALRIARRQLRRVIDGSIISCCCRCVSLLLLLLILAFANPFINRNAAALASNRLVLLVVDNSFSMRAGTRLADAKDAAMSVLAGKGAARAQVAAFGSQLRLMTQPIEDQSALRAAVQSIQPGDGHGNFGELARAVRATAEAVHTPIELHLFSDMQRGDLAATFSDMALPANVKAGDARRGRPRPNPTGPSNPWTLPDKSGARTPSQFTYKP